MPNACKKPRELLIWEEEKQVEKVQILLYFSKLINFYQGEENTVKLGYNELHGTNEIFTSTTVYNNVIKPSLEIELLI